MDTTAVVIAVIGLVVIGLGLGLGIPGMVMYLARTRQPAAPALDYTLFAHAWFVDYLVLRGVFTDADRHALATAAGTRADIDALLARVADLEQTRATNLDVENIWIQIRAIQATQGTLRADVDANRDNLARTIGELADLRTRFNGHNHTTWSRTLPAPSPLAIVIGMVVGFVIGILFNTFVDEGTVLGYIYVSNVDDTIVKFVFVAIFTAIGGALGYVISSFRNSRRTRTSRPQAVGDQHANLTHTTV